MLKFIIVFAIFMASTKAVSVFESLEKREWELWKAKFNKSYGSLEEEQFRWKIFMENKLEVLNYVTNLNGLLSNAPNSDEISMNPFSDLLNSEFSQMMNGAIPSEPKELVKGMTFISPANVELPNQVDWRKMGAVTPVKNQGQCGSCWTFSATGSLEGQHFRKTGKLVSLSEQELLDCSGRKCKEGGWVYKAFELIKQKGGIDTEDSYPYEGTDGHSCRHKKRTVGATDNGYTWIPKGNEEALKSAVATRGPVSVAIYGSDPWFQRWSKGMGIYRNIQCPKTTNHAVLIVGYGTERGLDYWLVKNSWGTYWGDEGYIKMARNVNICGIANEPVMPLV